jgi:hypothetical protein
MAQVAPRFATPPNALPLPKAADLPLTRTDKRPWIMPGEMLAPYTHGAKTFDTGSLHLFALGLSPPVLR